MTDIQFAECIQKMRSGSRQGLEEIYREYYSLVYSAALAAVNDRTDAEDIVSDFFVRLWLGVSEGKIVYDSSYKGHKRWLAVSARNLAVDLMRSSHRHELTDEIPEEDAPRVNTEDTVIDNMQLKKALDSIDPTQREVIHLKHFAGYTLSEIAEILSIPQGTAAWRYRTGIAKLKKILKEAF